MKYLTLMLIVPIFIFSQRFGPSEINSIDPPISILPLTPEVSIDVASTRLENTIDEESYRIGPFDKFLISIEAGESATFVAVVTPSGRLLVPKVGSFDLSDKTLTEAKKVIENSIKGKYRQGRVTIELIGIRDFSIPITGAVENPGFYVGSPVTRVSSVLKLAIPRPLAALNNVLVTNMDGVVSNVDITSFYARGELVNNPILSNGDRIHIPLSNITNEVVVIRGALKEKGFISILPNETLSSLVARKIDFSENADIKNVFIIRQSGTDQNSYKVSPKEFTEFILKGGDEVEFLYEMPVRINGYVAAPGAFEFIPGYSATDYIFLAGGLLPSGTMRRVKITRQGGEVVYGQDIIIAQGDIVEVNRSVTNIIFGEVSVVQLTSTFATIVLAVLAVK